MEMGLLFGVGALIYFLPSLIGTSKANSTAIFALNLLAGWTIIGWIIALVWALTKEPVVALPSPVAAPAPAVPAVAALPADPKVAVVRLQDLRDRGIISQETFLEELGKL